MSPRVIIGQTGSTRNLVNPSTNTTSPLTPGYGPWFIETQWMDIEYQRVPVRRRSRYTPSMVALSGTHTITGSIDATYAIAKAVVHYSVQKSSDYFPGDEQLPQQFSLSPVSGMDHLDIQYGTSLCSSGWGPKGEINSSLTPWYNRRLWDATTDVEVSKTETVYTFKVKESDLARIKDPLAEDQFKNYNWDENNADFLLADSYKGCLGTTPYINNAWRIYWMNGPYNMEDEDDVTASDKLKLFCNQVGIEIRTGGDIYKPVWDNEGKSVILSSYDENRHSW